MIESAHDNWKGKCVKEQLVLSNQWVHNDAREAAVCIIDKVLKRKVEQQQQYQNKSTLVPIHYEDIKEVLDINIESEMSGISILHSLYLENESGSNNIEYLSDFTAESFANTEM